MNRLLFFISFVLVVSFASVSSVFAAGDFGLKDTADAAGLSSYGSSVPELVGSVVGTALSMISVLFFILTVYGGVLWMTARGNEEQAKKALNTIIAASIGLIIVLSSYALTTFVFNSVSTGNGGGSGGGTSGAGGTGNSNPILVCQCAIEISPVDNFDLDNQGNEDVCIVSQNYSVVNDLRETPDDFCLALCITNSTLSSALSEAQTDGLEPELVVEAANQFGSQEMERALSDAQLLCGPYVENDN